MTDPRALPGYPERFWNADERDYVAHLIAHEDAVADPHPEPGDSHEVGLLLELLESKRLEARTITELIAALRKVGR
jgi:hypothetical protein